MTSRKEGEGVRQSVTLGHKCVTEGGRGLKIAQISVTSFMNAPLISD